jgi:hypothetical protein
VARVRDRGDPAARPERLEDRVERGEGGGGAGREGVIAAGEVTEVEHGGTEGAGMAVVEVVREALMAGLEEEDAV